MTKDPWTDPDPQPEDFDAYIRAMDPRDIEYHEGNSGAKVTIVADATGEEAKRLERIALESDPPLDDVLADLRRARERRTPSQPARKRRTKRARAAKP
jgi:hypothetical protein